MAMEYDDAAADRLEAVYLGPDVVAQREDTLRRIAVMRGEHVLDIGSGPGFLAAAIAEQTGPDGEVIGVDVSQQMVDRANQRRECDWLRYRCADATALPLEDSHFDVAVSTQVAEYVPDIVSFLSEFHRVLKPGGRGLILATDWGGVCWHSENPDRMKKVLAAFAPHCADSELPRTLNKRLRQAGLVVEDVSYFPIVNVDRYEGCYSEMIVPFITAYVQGQGSVDEDDLRAWGEEQAALDARGEHFFATGRFSFAVRKPDRANKAFRL
ncbi:methyltransferase domain-containing protein [uncultured Roseovarius sp.]|uniref:methyltransferase domain-containing protein n=1 Tax=uncultured Roseovarius sp. TaxID=293344 RepID=UPI0025F95B98|nr:methyltransferase domain-containing protein [uncultured Roseovarius sp.]